MALLLAVSRLQAQQLLLVLLLTVSCPEIERKKLQRDKEEYKYDKYGAALQEAHLYIISPKEQ